MLDQGEYDDFGAFVLAALTDLDNSPQPRRFLLHEADFAALPPGLQGGGKPLLVLLHAGEEYVAHPGPRQRYLARLASQGGVDLLAGAHPHVPGLAESDAQGWRFWSLGNLIFDSRRHDAAGALLELVFFQQGTFWARQIGMGNLYQQALARGQGRAAIVGKGEL